MLNAASLESARFGLRVFRAILPTIDVDALFEELIARCVDLAIIRTPGGSDQLYKIAHYGLHPLHADTLVTYECALQDITPKPLKRQRAIIDVARRGDGQAIIALVKEVFAYYPNHYHANPLLDREDVLDGYCEWALSHIDGKDGNIAWVARVDNRIAAIACSAFDEATGICHGVLHGVHPDFSGSGIYTNLIRHTQHHFRERGYRTLKISTQVGNLPVQRVWVREGFVFAEVFDTFHVNALLDLNRIGTMQTVSLSDGHRGQLLRGQAMTGFLAAAFSDQRARQASTDTGTEECCATIFDELENQADYQVRVRRYRRAHLPDRTFCSATLHDVTGKIHGMAQFVARSATP